MVEIVSYMRQRNTKWARVKNKLKKGAVGLALGATVASGGCAAIFKSHNPLIDICRSNGYYMHRNTKSLIKQLRQSTVLISSSRSQGSGIIIGHKNNETIILTNHHVVTDSDGRLSEGLKVRNNGKTVLPKKIVIAPHELDLAVIYVKGRIGPCRVADMGTPDVGENVLVVGSPLGSEDSVSKGIVSNLRPDKTRSGFKYKTIQTDSAVNPGNSGGGIFDAKSGKLLGIISFKLRMSMFETAEGMAFALPVSLLKEFPIEKWRGMKRDH
jgi:S1-C subfamily serine protease